MSDMLSGWTNAVMGNFGAIAGHFHASQAHLLAMFFPF